MAFNRAFQKAWTFNNANFPSRWICLTHHECDLLCFRFVSLELWHINVAEYYANLITDKWRNEKKTVPIQPFIVIWCENVIRGKQNKSNGLSDMLVKSVPTFSVSN